MSEGGFDRKKSDPTKRSGCIKGIQTDHPCRLAYHQQLKALTLVCGGFYFDRYVESS